MHFLDALVRAATTPSPTPTKVVDPNTVTPGVGGFLVMAVLVAVVVLLLVDMNRRVRRTRYRGEVNEELDREEAERAAAQSEAPEGTPSEDERPDGDVAK